MLEDLPNSPPKTPGSVAQSSCSSPIYYDQSSTNRSKMNNNFTADELLDRMLMGKWTVMLLMMVMMMMIMIMMLLHVMYLFTIYISISYYYHNSYSG
jgi:hypothetical protein